MSYEVVGHRSPYKRIDLRGRRFVITLEEVQNNLVRHPDPAAYIFNGFVWTLRDGC